MPRGAHQAPVYVPKPEDIRRECARIQRTWSNRQERERAGRVVRQWAPPVIGSTVGEEIDREIQEGAESSEQR